MKKIGLLLLFVLTGMSVRAQMMPDSTVQFVAYWNVGDKYQYSFESISKEVDANGDTTIVKESLEIAELEVVAKTEDSYQLKMTTIEKTDNDPQSQLINKILKENGADIPILFSTNNLGTLTSLDNIPELSAAFAKAAEPLAMEILKSQGMSEEELKDYKGFDIQGFIKRLAQQVADPAIIQQSILDYIGRLFFFHGGRLEIDHTYSFEEPLNFIIPGMTEQLTAQTNFWVDGELTDESSAVCRTFTSANIGNNTVTSAIGTVSDMTMEYMDTTASAKAEVNAAIKEMLSDKEINISWEQYTTTEIHLNTGWPLRHYQDKYVKGGVSGEANSEEKIESLYIEIILSE